MTVKNENNEEVCVLAGEDHALHVMVQNKQPLQVELASPVTTGIYLAGGFIATSVLFNLILGVINYIINK